MLLLKVTALSAEQYANASEPISVTESGILSDVIAVFLKAPPPYTLHAVFNYNLGKVFAPRKGVI